MHPIAEESTGGSWTVYGAAVAVVGSIATLFFKGRRAKEAEEARAERIQAKYERTDNKDQIDYLRRRVEAIEAQKNKGDEVILTQNGTIAQQNDTIARLNSSMAELHSLLDESRSDKMRLRQENEAMATEIGRLQRQNVEQERKIGALRTEIDMLEKRTGCAIPSIET